MKVRKAPGSCQFVTVSAFYRLLWLMLELIRPPILALTTYCFFALTTPVEGAGAQAEHFEAASSYTVKIRSRVEYPFWLSSVGSFMGAGFLVNRKLGWIATNAHVTALNPSSLEISFKGQGYTPAQLIYVDHLLDFAIVSFPPDKIPLASRQALLDCELKPSIGRSVGAFGHPFKLSYSGTRGIVSGYRHKWGRNWIQTDAAINSGNSGGPLIDLETGRIIGINSASFSKRTSEGISFAVPMGDACKLIKLLEEDVDPSPPYIPVSFARDADNEEQLIVSMVYDKQPVVWPLVAGDQIIALSQSPDEKITSQADLIRALRGKAGSIDLLIERNGATEVVTVDLQNRPNLLDTVGVHVSGIILAGETLKDDELMNPGKLLLILDVKKASEGELAGVESFNFLASVDGRSFEKPDVLCTYLKSIEAAKGKVRMVTRSVDWEYQSQTSYKSHEIKVSNVRLVGPRVKEGCMNE